MWTEPRPTTHLTQAGGGGAAVADWEPGRGQGPPENASLWGLLHCLLAPLKQLALESLVVSKDSSQETAERAPWVPLALGVILTRAKVPSWKCFRPAGSPAS